MGWVERERKRESERERELAHTEQKGLKSFLKVRLLKLGKYDILI